MFLLHNNLRFAYAAKGGVNIVVVGHIVVGVIAFGDSIHE